MRAVLQRVNQASVVVDGKTISSIEKGLVVLLGVTHTDDTKDIDWIAEKIVHLRIFEDTQEKMNLSVEDIGGSVLLVSQFTLLGDAKKGRRPSFSDAAKPDKAEPFYQACGEKIREYGIPVFYGIFGAMMQVHLINDGPVTILLDSER